jgi:FAD:protein FMN transferase
MREHARTVEVFGGRVALLGAGRDAPLALAVAEALLRRMHAALTRFDPRSELCRLNDDARPTVPASALLRRLAAAVPYAGALSGGLVDATVEPTFAPERTAPTGDPRPATPDPQRRWAQVSVDGAAVSRPPGVALDSGGLGKGLFADLLAGELAYEDAFAVECAGDLRVGGTPRQVHVASPFGGPPLHTFRLADAAAATSGIGRRSWLDAHGRPAHHLLDPSTGTPAFTGVVQATAIAPTAVEAEIRAKAAVLSGPDAAASWLPHGGVIVDEDGRATLVESSTLGQQTQAPSPEMIGGCAAPCW